MASPASICGFQNESSEKRPLIFLSVNSTGSRSSSIGWETNSNPGASTPHKDKAIQQSNKSQSAIALQILAPHFLERGNQSLMPHLDAKREAHVPEDKDEVHIGAVSKPDLNHIEPCDSQTSYEHGIRLNLAQFRLVRHQEALYHQWRLGLQKKYAVDICMPAQVKLQQNPCIESLSKQRYLNRSCLQQNIGIQSY